MPIGVFLLVAVGLGFIPAAIASGKGRSFLGWWIFGVLLWIIALPCAILIDPLTPQPAGAAPVETAPVERVPWHKR